MKGEPTFLLRPFAPGDIDAVWELVHRTIGHSYREHYGPPQIRFFQDYHPREKILDDAASGTIVVAERDGNIAGTGTLREGHLRRVFVDPDCHGRGIGSAIVGELETAAVAGGVSYVDLSSALGSRTFWEAQGYHIVEEHFTPVGNGVTIHYYTMGKELP